MDGVPQWHLGVLATLLELRDLTLVIDRAPSDLNAARLIRHRGAPTDQIVRVRDVEDAARRRGHPDVRQTMAAHGKGRPRTANGLPIGLEIDGQLGSDQRFLRIVLSVEALLGSLNAPQL